MHQDLKDQGHAPIELADGETGYWCPGVGRAVRACGRGCNAGHIHEIEQVPGKKPIVRGGPVGASCARLDEQHAEEARRSP